MSTTYSLHRIAPNDKALVDSIIELHATLLPHSPVVLLGRRFLEDFYYSTLPAMELIVAWVAIVNGVPAGFIVATDDSAGFMGRAIRHHWIRLLWTIGASIAADPRRIQSVFEAYRIMSHVGARHIPSGTGEMLSFGVLEQFRTRRFIRETGITIGADLLERAVQEIERRDVTSIRAVVDQDNTQARMFYSGRGWQMGETVAGWKVPVVEYVRGVESPCSDVERAL